jgi:hypothetical protein
MEQECCRVSAFVVTDILLDEINQGNGPSMELAEGRSVSKQNTYAFHPDFVPHWAHEIEFSFEKYRKP